MKNADSHFPSDLLTVTELAKRLKVPVSWVYSRTRIKGPGNIPRVQVGKYVRFNPDAVDKWIEDQQNDRDR
jgi:excisionase family DNA binding protein